MFVEAEFPLARTNALQTEEIDIQDATLQAKKEIILNKINDLDSIRKGVGAKEIVLSEWSDKAEKGRVIRVTDGGKCYLHQTDSKEDFDSHTKSNQ